jgi:outer membrane protein TolC
VKRHVACTLTLLLGGCVSVPPQPIDPAASAHRLAARSFDDPRVVAAERKAGLGEAPLTLDRLTVAGWTLRPEIGVAAADLAAAQAGVRTAHELPNPTLTLDPSYLVDNANGNLSPWTVAAALGFTIELGNKRAIRTAQARADSDAKSWAYAEALWAVRADIRKALITRQLAQQSLTLAETELGLRQSFSDWVENEFKFGAAGQPERLTAASNLAQARAALRTARGDLTNAESALAAAVGLTVAKLPLAQISPLPTEALPTIAEAEETTLRDAALRDKLSIRRSLAEYGSAEQALQLAVAKQYPDLAFGPGYTYDKGDKGVTLNLGFTLPLFHGQGAAIAEAMAARQKAAAGFETEQAHALSALDTAVTAYRAALAALDDARAVERSARGSVDMTNRRLELGGADRGEIVAAQLTLVTAQRASLDALRTALAALGDLEDAVQRPLWPTSTLSMTRPSSESQMP